MDAYTLKSCIPGQLETDFMFMYSDAFKYVCAPRARLSPSEVRREHQIPWNWRMIHHEDAGNSTCVLCKDKCF